MYSVIGLLALGLLPITIFAAPGPSRTEERASSCETIYPEFARIDEAQPVQSYLPGFIISQEAGATNKNDMLIEFTVPPNSYGCQLETFFPPGFPITASGRTDVYVYSVDGPLSRSPLGIDVSWFNAPEPISQVGTVTAPNDQVVNSFACEPTLTYRLSIGRDFTDAGSVSFPQSTEGGLRMTFNC